MNELPSLDQTPATEWANDAKSALGVSPTAAPASPVKPDTPDRTSSTASLPGSNFPGAFPGGNEQTSAALATGFIESVKQKLPAQQDIVDTAKQYLPAPVAAYINDNTGANNATNATRDVNGAKSEPTTNDTESNVEPRTDTSKVSDGNSAAEKPTSLAGKGISVKELIDKKKELDKEEALTQGANKPLVTIPQRVSTDSVPTTSSTAPNAASEFRSTCKAAVPTSPISEQTEPKPASSEAAATEASETPPPAQSDSPSEKSAQPSNDKPEAKVNKDFSNGYGAGYHPAELHPNSPAQSNATAPAESHKRTGSTNTSSSDSKTSSETRRKVSLKDKIKGEVKVISGKLGGKPAKVEEGKRILLGEV